MSVQSSFHWPVSSLTQNYSSSSRKMLPSSEKSWGWAARELSVEKLDCRRTRVLGDFFALLLGGEKVRKNPLLQAHLRLHEHQLEMRMMQMNFVLGENLEDLHQEYQRSARHLLNSVLGENLEDLRVTRHPAELECPRSAP